MSKSTVIPGSKGGQHFLGGLIDHSETYGSHIIQKMIAEVSDPKTIIDIGAGTGRDLLAAKATHGRAKTVAIEAGKEYAAGLANKVDQVCVLNIERDIFPFEDNSIDVIIANQILEHTKEVFWIFHEVSRILAPGGSFIFGVPNILSMHNRIGGFFGIHPTQHKLYSAHVRPFSKVDTIKFVNTCAPGTFELADFAGSQFYPFPKFLARPMASIFPTLAFSIFFRLQKVGDYEDQFLRFPSDASLETNFYIGCDVAQGQY